MKSVVLGSGAWGTALAMLLSAKGIEASLITRTELEAQDLNSARENITFLPGIKFPKSMRVTACVTEELADAEVLFIAVPAQSFRMNLEAIKAQIRPGLIIVSAAKGLEIKSCARMTEIIGEVCPRAVLERAMALSGPNLAREIATGLPATTVIAGRDAKSLAIIQKLLSTNTMRVYTNADVIGVELGGALKNVVALAAGMCDGFRVGDNAKSAVVTRGLTEMTRLGVAAGAQAITFAGLTGLGDLAATCYSPLSRNRAAGEMLALGRTMDDVKSGSRSVTEGLTTTLAVCSLAERYEVEMPIAEIMRQVLLGDKDIREAGEELMTRQLKSEFAGIGPD